MDELVERSLAAMFPRPSLPLSGGDVSGIAVTRDEGGYKLAVRLPDSDAKDVELRLDRDGRVLRLTGEVRYPFERAIRLGPDIDVDRLEASAEGDVVTVVAPRIKRAAPEPAGNKAAEKRKIEIKVEGDVSKENSKDEKAETEPTVEAVLGFPMSRL